MKRSNKIFFAGLLCFSLGYIANDLVREAGVKLAGSARAFPISPITAPTAYGSRARPQPQRDMLVSHTNETVDKILCPPFEEVMGAMQAVKYWMKKRQVQDHRIFFEYNPKWLRGAQAIVDVRRLLCHF